MRKLTWNLYASHLFVVVLALCISTFWTATSVKQLYLERTGKQLEAHARLVRNILEKEPALPAAEIRRLCESFSIELHTRITVILTSGRVVGDSAIFPAAMDDHSDRPEIRAAFSERTGLSSRYSYTLEKDMIYVAVPVHRNNVIWGAVRAAVSCTVFQEILNSMYRKIAVGCTVTVLFAAGVGILLSGRITKSLAEIRQGVLYFARNNLQYRIPPGGPGEIKDLAEALNRTAARLDERINTLGGQLGILESTFRSMVEAVIVVDRDGRIMRSNQAAGGLFDFSSADSSGRDIQEIIRQVDIEQFLRRTLSSSVPVEDVLRITAGGEKFLYGHGTLLRNESGETTGALLVFNDITRLKQLENMRREFVANVSHELKTPITAISGFVETLQDGAIREPEHADRFLGIISRNVSRLYAIIEDLLSLSKIEQEEDTGQIALSWKPLRPVLENAVTVCAKGLQEKQICLEMVCKDSLSANINSELLEQVVVNLLDNAVKYSDPGGTIIIRASQSDTGVIIAVEDNGCGIRSEHHARLFERFYRVDKARSCKLGGTGLGLAISKHIALAHQGAISVNSTPGTGSIFFLRLPLF